MEYECGFCDKRGSMDIFAHLSSGSMEENSETFIACPDCGSETINPVVIIKIDSKKDIRPRASTPSAFVF